MGEQKAKLIPTNPVGMVNFPSDGPGVGKLPYGAEKSWGSASRYYQLANIEVLCLQHEYSKSPMKHFGAKIRRK